MFIRIVIMGIIGFVGPDVFWVLMRDDLPYTEDESFVLQIAFMFLFAGAAAVDILHDAIKPSRTRDGNEDGGDPLGYDGFNEG